MRKGKDGKGEREEEVKVIQKLETSELGFTIMLNHNCLCKINRGLFFHVASSAME